MGRRRKGRDISGVLLLDKPTGITSNDALQRVKRLFGARKAGHTGSLDPLASGLLPICLGEATKVSGFLLDADKTYEVVCRLGMKTATGDAEGEIVDTVPVPALDESGIEAALARFRGDIEQIPPMYSAIKHEGQRLYKLAREGVEVERKPRNVTIRELACLAFDEATLTLRVVCTKGTYIRVLAEEIGEALGTVAHVQALRRTGAGPFDDAALHTMEGLEGRAETGREALDEALEPVDSALRDWPDVRLTPDTAYYFQRGQPVMVPGAPINGWVRTYEEHRCFLGLGEILDDGRVAPRRLIRIAGP